MTSPPVTRTVAAYATNAPGRPQAAVALLSTAARAVEVGRLSAVHPVLSSANLPSDLATVWEHASAAAHGSSDSVRREPSLALPLLVAAAVLAVHGRSAGEDRCSTVATAVGADVGVALVRALGPAQAAAGWDVVGANAAIAIAVAAGRLRALSSCEMVNVIGLATTQAAGLHAVDDPLSRSIVWAKAAANGVEAVALAAAGLTAPPTALEGRRGLAALTAAGATAAEGVAGMLGTAWPSSAA